MADIKASKASHRDISIAELERELAEELAVDLVVQINEFLESAPTNPAFEPPPALERAPSGTQPPRR